MTEAVTVHFRGWVTAATTSLHELQWECWVANVEDCANIRYERATLGPIITPAATPEQQAIRERAAATAATRMQEFQTQQTQREKAAKTAEELLRKYLTPAQEQTLTEVGVIHIKGSEGGAYRLGRQQGISRMENGVQAERLCCHPDSSYPWADVMLTQKLWLEIDERGFRGIANITKVEQPVAPPTREAIAA